MIIQPKVARWAVPLLQPRRYKAAKGGRSGGKSHQFMEFNVADMAADPDFKIACIREVQKSIRFSVKALMEQKIVEMGVSGLFDVQETVIKRRGGTGIAIFEGMQDHTADSVKGLEAFDRALVDEANALSDRSMRLLTPTLRKQGSEIHFAWNPEDENAPVDVFFRDNEGDPDFICVHVNITDNPFASETAFKEYYRAKALAEKKMAEGDPNAWDQFQHVWHGAYNVRSDKYIFRNWRVGDIDVPDRAVWFYGVDFGFATDPTAALRCCLVGRKLYIDAEAYEVGVPTESLPALLGKIPEITKWRSVADSARPETIDYLQRHGFPKMRGANKGKGSVEDGITFLQGLDIVVSPRCPNMARELGSYAYKVDKRTGEILPIPEDANNHLIDALRYACERLHRKGKLIPVDEVEQDDRLETPPDYNNRHRAPQASWKTF